MHLTEADVARYVGDRLDGENRERVESHLAGCSSCVEQVAALARLAEEMPVRGEADIPAEIRRRAEHLVHAEGAGHGEKGGKPWGPMRYAIAAMLLVVVGVTYFSVTDRSTPDQFRSERAPASFDMVPSDGVTLARADLAFEWAPVNEATSYRLTIYDLEGTPLWSATSAEHAMKLPDTVALQSGATYLWRVEAIFPDDTRFRSSLNAFTFSP
jgi:predicted anti-sigma-YlaC factor YlaD